MPLDLPALLRVALRRGVAGAADDVDAGQDAAAHERVRAVDAGVEEADRDAAYRRARERRAGTEAATVRDVESEAG